MSAGHKGDSIGLNSGALDRLLRNDEVRKHLYGAVQLNREYDLPYLAGYSRDGHTIYIDKHLPQTVTLQLDGQSKKISPDIFLACHERLEKALIDALGYGYAPAHKAATAWEKRHVLMMIGPGWWGPYEKVMDRYIKADEHEKLLNVPSDLDMTPYYAAPIDRKLIAQMEEAMGKAENKSPKADVDYSPGMPKSHCGRVPEWPKKGDCTHFVAPHSCALVRGAIDPKYWCKKWSHEDEHQEAS